VSNAEKRVIEKTEEINGAISQLWREAGGLKGSVLNFYNPKLLLKTKGGVLFIGFTPDVFNYERALKRYIKMPDRRGIDFKKIFFANLRQRARHVGCRNKWAYIDLEIGLRAKRREYPAIKTLKGKTAAHRDFSKKIDSLTIDLVKTVIDELKPKCVVSCNGAGCYLAEKMKIARQATILDSDFERTGFHLWNGRVPVFLFGSMRKTGIGNIGEERLRWHIKRALKWSPIARTSRNGKGNKND